MRFAIITQVPHLLENGSYFSYAPYVREMNIWLKYTDQAIVVAPLADGPKTAVDMAYASNIEFRRIPAINLLGSRSVLKAVLALPQIGWKIFRAMQKADHIHLRCPGNIGLLGCFIQILFPHKPKTAKYAGNWDPDSPQPWSYKLQRRILSNTFLTRNMQVLVYGKWEGSSANIKPFFTATYRESDKVPVVPRSLQGTIRFLFVGTLAPGKRPMYAAEIIRQLSPAYNVQLEMYGEGKERAELENYIVKHHLQDKIILKGNQSESEVRQAYQSAHFMILPSQSEGWPKVVAEAMFWGCVPLASRVSCVPDMLGNGKRGLLLEMDPENDIHRIEAVLAHAAEYRSLAENAIDWSRQYTLDVFEHEIRQLLKSSKS